MKSLNPILLFYLVLLFAFLVTRLPKVNIFFRSINTLVHECGHAIMALLCKGKVYRISLNVDASGSATTGSKNRLSSFAISLAGYPSASLLSFFCFKLYSDGAYSTIFLLFGVLSLLSLLLWVRNAFGICWLICFVALNAIFFYFRPPFWTGIFALILTSILFIDSLFSVCYILKMSFSQPQKAGDATNLHKQTKIPACIWGILFTAISLILAYYSILFYFPKPF